ncbi:MAG: hypothetical protein N3D18_15165 [Roseococcus sp.]|nr:hypothetical protein [Roseococcus sp.]
MIRAALFSALLLSPAALAAQEMRCWVPYAEFEPHVRHTDVARCPGDDPAPDKGFCRMAIEGEHITVYRFLHEAAGDQACLVAAERLPIAEFLRRYGLTYRAP